MAEVESRTTTDHEKIRQWAESRGGHPAHVASTGNGGDPGLLRIKFDGDGEAESLEEISWDEFFEKFEEKKLAFLYQEERKSGGESRFFKFLPRDGA
ncbi:MAG: hypothetical protein ACOCVR_01850 [Myxococcota bacterium]